VRKSKIKQISLAVCLALIPLSVYAAGLGKLDISSGLGEPLKAEIELLSVTPDELSTLAATIASEEAYAAQGITRLGIHNSIKVELSKKADGSPVLKLRSNQPVSDPYLDVLIQVDWATGRLQREYTVLLDPPGYKPSDSASDIPVKLPSVSLSNNNVVQNNISANTSAMPADQSSAKKSKSNKKQAVQAIPSQNEVADSVAGQELVTKRGDTLSSVARDLQIHGVSLDQMLVGLYENNQSAFTSGNMNRLKVGQIIKVPTKESLVSVSPQEARKSVKVHSTNWSAYRNNLAGAVSEAPATLDNEQKQSSSGKISTAVDKATPVKVGPQDVVKLSAGDKDSSKALDSKIVALQEESTAREKALKEAEERALALEKQIADMQKLLALKNQSMTELQKNAEAVAKAPEVAPEVKVDIPAQEASKTETTSPVEEKTADSVPIVKTEINKPEHKIAPPPVEPEVEPGLFEGIMNSADLAVIGGATGVALLGAGWMYLRNKRRKELDSFERGILTSGGLRANTVFGNTTGNASTSDTSFLTDFAQSADGSMIDTNDVDPIAEAEVYMAYGRDAQAEEILKDAISKEPKRYELHLKLLEMYAARKDTSAFEAIAGELYTTLGADDPTWAKVAELGASMEPENPLYDVSKIAPATSLATQKLDVSDFSDVAVSTSANLDFSLDDEPALDSQQEAEEANSAVMQSFSASENVEQDASFDLGAIDVALESDSADTKTTESLNESQDVSEINTDNSMDFDLGDFVAETPVANDAISVAEELPTFDVALTMDEVVQDGAIDLPNLSESSVGQSPDLDMNFDLSEADAEVAIESKSELSTNTADDISFDLDFSVDAASQTASSEEDNTVANFSASEISFDLPDIEEPEVAVAESVSQSKEFEANAFDLSSISLDLGETEHELTGAESVESVENETVELGDFADISSESPDVNIKLDLVAAYIDMDDKEGARELLGEVIKEGGTQQKLRAQQLIDSLA